MRTRPSRVRTRDGVQLALRVEPATTTPPAAAVVVVHGFGASSTEERVDAVVRALSRSGYAVVTYDARGHGASSGETTLGALERHDVAAAVEVASGLASRVVLVGTSMGAIAALRHAAHAPHEHPERLAIAGVITVACPARWRLPRNLRGIAAALMVETPWGRAFARSRMGVRIAPRIERGAPPTELARALHCPVAVVHGTDDPFIAPSDAELLHSHVSGPSRLVVVDGMAHSFEPPELVIPAILETLDWVLAHPPPEG